MRNFFMFILVLCLSLVSVPAFAQDIQTRGSISGQVVDTNKAAVAGATVKVTGAEGERTVTTNDQGMYTVDNLIPGTYKVRIEAPNFKATEVSDVVVFVGKTATTNVTLAAGNISETVTVTAGAEIDQASTAGGSNLNDQLYKNVPLSRGVSSLFYLAPGTTGGLGGGADNPSISGGSALDNLYIADGVNITDSAFGGIGTFSRIYGALGTGINTSFVKEVQIKTSGFEPQYGQSQGGIINIITQSGGNEYHGAIYGFARPKSFEATSRFTDDFNVNKGGKFLHHESYDVGADVGGPIVKNKLFFFGSFNPTVNRDIVRGAQGSRILTLLGDTVERTRTLNYAFKTDWNINPNHQVTFSIFGDPNKTNLAPFRSLNVDVLTAMSKLDYGTRNMAGRYNGSITPTWTVSASLSQGRDHFTESGFAPFNQITDRTQPTRGNFRAIGLGFFENTTSKTNRLTIDTKKIFTLPWHLGTHTVGVGYQFQRAYFDGLRDRSGPKFTVPSNNATGNFAVNPQAAGQPVNATFSLRFAPAACTACPLMTINDPALAADTTGFGAFVRRVVLRQDRGEFGSTSFKTQSKYNAGYIQDTWRVNKYVTALLGLRMEQERIIGQNIAYSFTDQWAPRLGVTVDPLGHGKTKIYYNYGRFFEYLPLDAAERSLSTEQDFIFGRFAPEFTVPATGPFAGQRVAVVNQFGTVNPVIDNAHFLSKAVPIGCKDPATLADVPCFGAPLIATQDNLEQILPGTKLGFADEHVFGFEQQLPKNFVLSVRYINRHLGRIIEDAAIVSPEGALAGIGQLYFIGNINSRLDAGVNLQEFVYGPTGSCPPAGDPNFDTGQLTDPFGAPIGGACFSDVGIDLATGNSIISSDGKPDGFPDPVHRYKAVEIELNKRFSNNWQLLSNFRIAKLRGNFEGHLRNDNGQTDPGISSLFDFTTGMLNLLGTQFASGKLNTDRKFVSNIYGSYTFSKVKLGGAGRRLNGLNVGLGIHMESGLPLSEFFAHPVYLNAGEIPVGGRGKLGRSSFYTKFDLHADYPIRLSERMKLKLVADFFNITNDRRVFIINQFRESTQGQLNPDFGQPAAFHPPFYMRLGARLEF